MKGFHVEDALFHLNSSVPKSLVVGQNGLSEIGRLLQISSSLQGAGTVPARLDERPSCNLSQNIYGGWFDPSADFHINRLASMAAENQIIHEKGYNSCGGAAGKKNRDGDGGGGGREGGAFLDGCLGEGGLYVDDLHALLAAPQAAEERRPAQADEEPSMEWRMWSDEFCMYEFKVRRCMRGRSHDWTDCPFAHPGEKARRRDPRCVNYSGTPCPDYRKGVCRKGEACELSHGVFECWLHPARYRTQPCKDGKACKRRVCFFAHSPSQLRLQSMTCSQAYGIQDAGARHSPDMHSNLLHHAQRDLHQLHDFYIGDFSEQDHSHGGFSVFRKNFPLPALKSSLDQLTSPTSILVGNRFFSPPPLSPPLSPAESPPASPDSAFSTWNCALSRKMASIAGGHSLSYDAFSPKPAIGVDVMYSSTPKYLPTTPSPLSAICDGDQMPDMDGLNALQKAIILTNEMPTEPNTQTMADLISMLKDLRCAGTADMKSRKRCPSLLQRIHSPKASHERKGYYGLIHDFGQGLRSRPNENLPTEEIDCLDLGWVNELVK